MRVYAGSDVNELYKRALADCAAVCTVSTSRVGRVHDLGPACFELDANKVNLPTVSGRGLNPFFAIAEACWVLGGLNQLDVLQYYLKDYDAFSDDGITLSGAYGHRIRKASGFDQIDAVVHELKKSPDSRRAVISIYSPNDLRKKESKDIPCNISVLFKIRNGLLDMTVMNRSNDIYWGIPYNFFVFQSLHYYIHLQLNISLGMQRHISDSLHLYDRDMASAKQILSSENIKNPEIESSNLSIFDAVISNIKAINTRDFDSIKCNNIRKSFLAYKLFRSSKNRDSLIKGEFGDFIDFLISDWLNVKHRTTNLI